MSKYNYTNDLRNVIIDGNEFSIFNELNYMGEVESGTLRPYIRTNTKIAVYKDYRDNHPNMYEVLKERDWFGAYRKQVEDVPQMVVPKEVSKHLDEKTSEKPSADAVSFEQSMNKLADTIMDMNSKIESMNTNTKLESALIEGIVDKGKELAVEDIKKELLANVDNYIKEVYGSLPTRLIITKNEIEYEQQGLFHKMFDKVLKLVNMNLPVMLTGGAGAGKNFMLEQVSQALDMSFYYTSTITQEYKLTGFIDGGGTYHETEFYKAFTQGGVFMLDEIDASIPEALVILNGAIANGYFDFPVGREIAHEDFRVVCAGNTVGLGADMVYTGRNVLDGATLDRFVLVEIDYDERIERNLCQDDELRDFLYDVRRSVKENRINHIIGMRAFKYSYELLVNDFDKKFIVDSVILKGLQQDDINVIKNSLRGRSDWHSEV